MPTDEEYFVAQALDCFLDDDLSWPWSAIERLVIVKREQGEAAFWKEVRNLSNPK